MVSPSQYWQWKTLLEAAILECDLTKLPERIIAAQKVVGERMQQLDSVSEAEELALIDAHNVLCDLCKMCGLSERPFQRTSSQ